MNKIKTIIISVCVVILCALGAYQTFQIKPIEENAQDTPIMDSNTPDAGADAGDL